MIDFIIGFAVGFAAFYLVKAIGSLIREGFFK